MGLERYDAAMGIHWSWLGMDWALNKSPLGGGTTGPKPTDRGKTSVKRSILTEVHALPVGPAMDGENRHDMRLVRATVDKPPGAAPGARFPVPPRSVPG